MSAAISLASATAAAMALAVAIVCSLCIVPLVRAASRRVGIVDRPDPERKLHGREIALCGGLAVFIATGVGFALTLFAGGAVGAPRFSDLPSRWWVLFGAAAAMMLVGLIDDALTLRGRQKLLAQIIILSCVIGSGTLVETIHLFGAELELGIFAYPVTMLWLLGAVNALNLIDGADGMATTAGMIICAGLALLGLHSGASAEAIAAFSMAGALLGFLAYNRPPATIFLGDAGSMLIGLVVGVLATWSSIKESTVLAAAPVAVLAIPLFDSSIAILRRWLTGRSIYATDRAHLHHLLMIRFGPRGMLLVVASLCLATTAAAVSSVVLDQQWIAVLGALTVLGVLVGTRSFGHAELSLLGRRLANLCESLLTPARRCEERTQSRTAQLQGNRQWQHVWETLVEFADKHELSRIKLDLNISWMHEGYHGVWSSIRLPEKVEQMSLRIPLIAFDPKLDQDRVVGRLDVIARGADPAVYDTLERLAERLADLRPMLTELLIASEVDHRPTERPIAVLHSHSEEARGQREPVGAQASVAPRALASNRSAG